MISKNILILGSFAMSCSLAIAEQLPKPKKKKSNASVLKTVHPYFALENLDTLGNDELKVGGMCFHGEDLYVVTLAPDRTNKKPDKNGKLLRIENVEEAGKNGKQIKVSTVVEGFYEPCAVGVIGDSIYVGEKKRILRFDGATKKSGIPIDNGVVLVDGLSTTNFHTYTIGFERFERDGQIYFCGNFTTAIRPGGKRDRMVPPNPAVHRGSNFLMGPLTGKELPKDVKLEFLAGGFRTPNGVEVGPDNEVYVVDNQGIFNPSNELIRIKPGSFYGHYLYTEKGRAAAFQPTDINPIPGDPKGQTAATVHLPQGNVARSPAQPIVIDGRKGLLEPYNGQLLLCEFTTGGMLRVFTEQVGDVWQGCVFLHSGGAADEQGSNGFTGGPNRIEQGPDGNYYIGQVGAGRLWGFNGATHGLQRFRVRSESEVDPNFNEILTTRVIEGGFELEFLKPIPKDSITAEQIGVRQWTYHPTQGYGGPMVGTEKLRVAKIEFDSTGKKARLTINGLKDDSPEYVIRNGSKSSENSGWVVQIDFDPKVDKKSILYTKKCWYTLHRKIGGESAGEGDIKQLTKEEKIHHKFQSLCLSCHIERDGGWGAPSLKGIFGKKQQVIKDGKILDVVVDKDYLVNAILYPNSEKSLPFKDAVMPPLGISKEDAEELVEYIRKLK